MTVEENGGSTTYLVAVVLLASLAVLVCQWVGAGYVQVVLQADQFGRLVGLEQGVEGNIRRHTGRALSSGEQLHQNDVVGLGIFSTGELLRREGRNLLAVFLVEPALQPGGTSLGGASNVRFAGKLQVPANLSVGSPTIAAEPAKSGIPARAGTIAIARKDREASLIVVVAAENSPLPAARGPAGRGATPQAGCPPAPPNVERNKRC